MSTANPAIVVPASTTPAIADTRCRSQLVGEVNHAATADVLLVVKVAAGLAEPVMALLTKLFRMLTIAVQSWYSIEFA